MKRMSVFGLRERAREDISGKEEKSMQNPQIDKKPTKQVRIDKGLHKLVKIRAAKSGETIKSLVENALAELLAVNQIDIQID